MKYTNNDNSCGGYTQRYTVLYYKRKNKVHKSKGVSKLDGTLAIVVGGGGSEINTTKSSPVTTVILKSCDTDEIVYRGGFRFGDNAESNTNTNTNTNRKNVFEVDAIIPVGGYEVEILSSFEDNNNGSGSSSNDRISTNNDKVNIGTRGALNSSSRNINKSVKNNRLKPSNSLLSNKTNKKRTLLGGRNSIANLSCKTATMSSGGLGIKRSRQKLSLNKRKPPVQPLSDRKKGPPSSFMLMEEKDADDGNNDIENNKQTASNNAFVQLNRRKKATHLPAFKKPTSTKNLSGRKINSSVSLPKNKLMDGKSKILNTSSKNFLPGAIGNPVVPASIRTVLRPHQIDGVVFIWNCLTGNGDVSIYSPHIHNRPDTSDRTVPPKNSSPKGCILCDEMGLGKTLMTIATISALHRQKRDNRFVIVCPSSLVSNWAREFDKWLGNVGLPRRVVVKKGGEEGIRKIKSFATVKPSNISEVLIVSYDFFRMNAKILEKVQKVALLVVDEGHRLKNAKGSLTMTALISLPCEARMCITATPIQNDLGDMYTLANFVCPGVLGDLATFKREYERPITKLSSKRNCDSDEIRRGNASRILDGIVRSIMLRRLQKDILKHVLPPRSVFLLFCQPTAHQRELYTAFSKSQSSKGTTCTVEALTALTKLRKICTHPNLFNQNYGINCGDNASTEKSSKLMVLNTLINKIREKEPTDKVVIVSNFTSNLTIIEDNILKPTELNFLRLDGSLKSADRQQVVDTFNRTDAVMTFALTLSSKAGGTGLNIIGANRLIMFDADWNPATDIQAMARIYRPGQKKPCFIYRLFTSGTIEEVILQRQMQKGILAAVTVDSAQKPNGNKNGMSADELRNCFDLKETLTCDTKEKVGMSWPDYDGKDSLISQSCNDLALLAVAARDTTESSPLLSFVHIVKEDDEEGVKQNEKFQATSNLNEELETADDEEFDNKRAESGVEDSSDAEFEFE